MESILEMIEALFCQKRQQNKDNYGHEYLDYISTEHFWPEYTVDGYIDKIRDIASAYFMTVEYCHPVSESNYILSTYSPCPLPAHKKIYLLQSSQEEDNLHRHDYYEMIYVYQGTRTTQIEDNTILLKEHDLCIFDTQCAHLDIRAQSEGIAFYCCFPGNLADSYFFKHLSNGQIRNFFFGGDSKNDVRYLKLHADQTLANQITSSLAVIFQEMELSNIGYEKIAQIHTLRILNGFKDTDDSSIYTFSKRLRGTKLFQAVARYISSNISDISLKKLCEQFHYQEDYYSRLIKKNTGLTYAQYVHALKMDKAKNLLTNTDMSVQEILQYLGYQSHSHFYKIFQEETGLTPTQYRQK